MNQKKVLIFGVFDGVHDGHLHFIKEAKSCSDQLVVVVARDSVVESLKGRKPKFNERERINRVLDIPEVDMVLLGDPEIGVYNVLKEAKPEIIFLGYDQDNLKDDLNKKIKNGYLDNIKILQGHPYKENEFHSSIINK